MTLAVRQRYHAPESVDELADVVRGYAETGLPIEVRGRGTRQSLGRPVQASAVVTTEAMDGIVFYEPHELVLGAYAGTPLSEIEQRLAKHNQQLAFEPLDLAPLYGGKPGQGSFGGIFATGLSGPRRMLAGAARDHILGLEAVNGRGEIFRAGGRVMKNVTGYDLPKFVCGSYGTLAVMTGITVKVLPAPEETATLLFFGLPEGSALEVMASAAMSPYEVSGAVHLEQGLAAALSDAEIAASGRAVTAIRVEGFDNQVRHRSARLKRQLAGFEQAELLGSRRSKRFWADMRQLKPFCGGKDQIWRIVTAPACCARLVEGLRRNLDVKLIYDWAGGLLWAAMPPASDAGAVDIRRLLSEHGGHATLIRAEPAIRAAVDVFQPLEGPAWDLTKGLKAAFDPAGILNAGRVYPGI